MSENDKQSRKNEKAWRTGIQEGIEEGSEILELLISDKISSAIAQTLMMSPILAGLRYNELYRQTQATLDKRGINELFSDKMKNKYKSEKISLTQTTFDKHLKKLIAMEVVRRIEKNKYNVRYQTPLTKKLNEAMLDMDLKLRVKKMQDVIGAWENFQEWGKWSNITDKEKRKDMIERYIRTLLYMVSGHLLECMCIGALELQDGKFVRFSSMLASTYRDIMLKVLIITAYLSGVPEVHDCLITIMNELPEAIRNQVSIRESYPETEDETETQASKDKQKRK